MNRWIDRCLSWTGRRSLIEILLVAVSMRVLIFAVASLRATGPEIFYLDDTIQYVQSASSLLERGEFSRDGSPDILRTPGYPLLLLPGLALGHLTSVTIGLQIALSCATVYLVYRLALLLSLAEPWAKLAALLYALEPLSILLCSKLMTETLFALVMVSFLFCTVAYLNDSRWRWLFLGGAALGLAILVRPIAYYLPLATGLALIVRALWTSERRWTKCLQAAVLVGVAWAPALAWQARNHAVAGYNRFAAIEDINLYFYIAASVLARQNGVTVSEQNGAMGYVSSAVYLESHPEQTNWTNVERYNAMRREALKILRANLGQYFVIHAEGIVPLLLGGGASETIQLLGLNHQAQLQEKVDQQFNGVVNYALRLLNDHFGLFCCNVALSLIALGFVIAAAFGAFTRETFKHLPLVFLLCVAAYFAALSGGPSGRPRYRHPIMPIACLFAAEGARRLAAGRKASRVTTEFSPAMTDTVQSLAA